MKIKLEKLSFENAMDILDFEKENKAYFETCLPPRHSSYYNIEEFNKITEELIEEQNNGECFMYVIRNCENEVVGRINLSLNNENGEKIAELGYRIGEKFNGKGIATEAVRLVFQENVNVSKVIAGTAEGNIGSQRVLEKNGFIFEGKTEGYIEINGVLVDSLNYFRVL